MIGRKPRGKRPFRIIAAGLCTLLVFLCACEPKTLLSEPSEQEDAPQRDFVVTVDRAKVVTTDTAWVPAWFPRGQDSIDITWTQTYDKWTRTFAVYFPRLTYASTTEWEGLSAIREYYAAQAEATRGMDRFPALDDTLYDTPIELHHYLCTTNDYEAVGPYLSVLFYCTMYGGGAHSMEYVSADNFDMRTGKLMTWEDVFGPKDTSLALLVRAIRAQIDTEKSSQLFDFIDGEPDLLSRQDDLQFRLTKDGVTFQFQPYEIGPYVMGCVFVTVPYSALSDILRLEISPGAGAACSGNRLAYYLTQHGYVTDLTQVYEANPYGSSGEVLDAWHYEVFEMFRGAEELAPAVKLEDTQVFQGVAGDTGSPYEFTYTVALPQFEAAPWAEKVNAYYQKAFAARTAQGGEVFHESEGESHFTEQSYGFHAAYTTHEVVTIICGETTRNFRSFSEPYAELFSAADGRPLARDDLFRVPATEYRGVLEEAMHRAAYQAGIAFFDSQAVDYMDKASIAVTPGGLTLMYHTGYAGPMAMGQVFLTLPYRELAEILNPVFFPEVTS